jgi:hypothetical protein
MKHDENKIKFPLKWSKLFNPTRWQSWLPCAIAAQRIKGDFVSFWYFVFVECERTLYSHFSTPLMTVVAFLLKLINRLFDIGNNFYQHIFATNAVCFWLTHCSMKNETLFSCSINTCQLVLGFFSWGEGHRSRSDGSTAAMRLIVRPCDEEKGDQVFRFSK